MIVIENSHIFHSWEFLLIYAESPPADRYILANSVFWIIIIVAFRNWRVRLTEILVGILEERSLWKNLRISSRSKVLKNTCELGVHTGYHQAAGFCQVKIFIKMIRVYLRVCGYYLITSKSFIHFMRNKTYQLLKERVTLAYQRACFFELLWNIFQTNIRSEIIWLSWFIRIIACIKLQKHCAKYVKCAPWKWFPSTQANKQRLAMMVKMCSNWLTKMFGNAPLSLWVLL